VQLTRSERWPSVKLAPYVTSETANERELRFGLGVTVPLPVLNQNAGNIETATAREAQAEVALNLALREVERKIADALSAYATLRAEMARWPADAVEKFRDAARKGDEHYRLGALPITTYTELQVSRSTQRSLSINHKLASGVIISAGMPSIRIGEKVEGQGTNVASAYLVSGGTGVGAEQIRRAWYVTQVVQEFVDGSNYLTNLAVTRGQHATLPGLTADDIPRLLGSLGLAAVPSRGRAKGGIAMAALKVGAVKAAALCLSLGAVLAVVAPAAAQNCRAGCGLQKKACHQTARVAALACKQGCRTTVAAASLGACKRACMGQFSSATDACKSAHDDRLGSCLPLPPPGSCTGAFLDSCGRDLAACAQGVVARTRTCVRGCRTAIDRPGCLRGFAAGSQHDGATCAPDFAACVGACACPDGCDDGNPCTFDACVKGACVHECLCVVTCCLGPGPCPVSTTTTVVPTTTTTTQPDVTCSPVGAACGSCGSGLCFSPVFGARTGFCVDTANSSGTPCGIDPPIPCPPGEDCLVVQFSLAMFVCARPCS